MASLNTLRTRGGVILSVAIGAALFAFILGEYISSGGGSNDPTSIAIGEINDSEVGYLEYLNETERFTQITQLLSGRDALSEQDQNGVRNMAWEAFVTKYSYNPGFEELGLLLGNDEQLDMVNGVYRSPIISSFFTNPETGIFDPMFIKNFLSNIDADPSGRSKMIWEYLKEQMNSERQMSKFMNLVASGIYVTDLEVEQSVSAANKTYAAKYVSQDYNSVADSLVSVSNSEIKAYYSKYKNKFQQGDSRNVEYVVFDLLPSQEDYADAQKYINEVALEFEVSKEPMQYASLNSHTSVDSRYLKESELGEDMVGLFNNPKAIYGPILNGDRYTVARLANMRRMPDSLGAKHILLPAEAMNRADSLVKVIKKGSDFATLSTEFSIDQTAVGNGGYLGVFTPEQMIPKFSDACIAQRVGNVFIVTTDYGIHVVELTKKSPMINKAQIATVVYDVEPSAQTQQNVYGEVSTFISKASDSSEAFNAAAVESALVKKSARIMNTSRNISGLDNALELVRWSFNSDKGNVSEIMEIDGDYIVATLTEVAEAGDAPLASVSNEIKNTLIKEKKADIIKSTMTETSLDAIATAVGVEVKEIKEVKFSSYYLDGLGYEPKVLGAICGSSEGQLSKPVDGMGGVYIIDVDAIVTSENATIESERVLLEAQAQNYIAERVNMALIDANEIKDERVKFF